MPGPDAAASAGPAAAWRAGPAAARGLFRLYGTAAHLRAVPGGQAALGALAAVLAATGLITVLPPGEPRLQIGGHHHWAPLATGSRGGFSAVCAEEPPRLRLVSGRPRWVCGR